MLIGRVTALSRSFGFTILLACLIVSLSSIASRAASHDHEPVVDELLSLLEKRADLHTSVDIAIETAALQGINDLDSFTTYLDELITWIPTEREIVPRALALHYIVNQAPGDKLNNDDEFSAWLKNYVDAWGKFLDTPASAAGIASFASMPNYNINDYFEGPSGWQTFNQFFAREMRPGKRPIAEPRDDTVVVSPADAVFMGQWPITEDSTITIKGVNWAVSELLDGSPYEDEFRGGIYMHSFLYIDDYHRYHVPVGGEVKEIRNISGRVYLDVGRNPDGSFDVIDGDTYQFNQERGLIVIDSPELGLVAVLPIGMSYVSSVNLTPELGAVLQKGDEFGYFMFGGSDVVVLFQDKNVVLDAEIGRKYLQGQRIGQMQ
ncbi:phosphatidylserine decarboxylase [Gammaproteobacteria bacterium]|jgi:phosphatidylserine decarboxylase precursor|nr:phosphatidylserine decarboxylase [Gammaproteobacteria bacterium]